MSTPGDSPANVKAAWLHDDSSLPRGSDREHTHGLLVAAEDQKLRSAILEHIRSAEDVIIICSFIIADDEILDHILQASQRSVRVYILTASEDRLKHDPVEGIEEHRVRDYRSMISRLASRCLLRSAPGFHAKALLIDPRTAARGIILTANLVHSDLVWNNEAAVILTPSEVHQVFDIVQWAFWEIAELQLLEDGKLDTVSPLQRVERPRPEEPVLAAHSSHDSISEWLQEQIRCHEEIVVSNFGFHTEHPVVTELARAATEGRSVTVLARASERTLRSVPALLHLVERGAVVKGTPRMHAKLAAFDDQSALLHTSNFNPWNAASRLELGVVLDEARAMSISNLLQDWVIAAPWTLATNVSATSHPGQIIDVADDRWRPLPPPV